MIKEKLSFVWNYFKGLSSKNFILYLLLIFFFWLGLFVVKNIVLSFFLAFLMIGLWKVLKGMSWLNFAYLLFGFGELKILAFWLQPLILVFLFVLFFVLVFKKLILDEQINQLLSYFLITGWILLSYGLYFYLNWNFTLSFLIYLSGFCLFSYFNFLLLEKRGAINYWVFILVNLEFYLLLHYLSLKGLQFSGLVLLLQYLLLNFI